MFAFLKMFRDTSERFCIWGWWFLLFFFFLSLPQAFQAGSATEESQSQPFRLILPPLLQFYWPNILMIVWWSGSWPWSMLKLPTPFFCWVTHSPEPSSLCGCGERRTWIQMAKGKRKELHLLVTVPALMYLLNYCLWPQFKRAVLCRIGPLVCE